MCLAAANRKLLSSTRIQQSWQNTYATHTRRSQRVAELAVCHLTRRRTSFKRRCPTVSSAGNAVTASNAALSSERGKVLVLGGTGFAGTEITKALLAQGLSVIAGADAAGVTFVSADLVQNPSAVDEILQEHGPFAGVVHCIGMLLPNKLNALASGSGSVPREGTSYDDITRKTAYAAADAAASHRKGCPFVFVSAAEAGWPEDAPLLPPFLRDYLAAKRAAEAYLQELGTAGRIKPVILRPSLIWTPQRPAALPPVAMFTLASMLGFPGVQRPVRVETLAAAAAKAVTDPSSQGVWMYEEMEKAARKQ